MLDKVGSNAVPSKRFWSPRDALEARLRRSYGETYQAIGEAIGFSADTVRIRMKRDGLKPADSVAERLALALSLVADTVAREALTGAASDAALLRQRQELRLLYQALHPALGAAPNTQDKEGAMKTIKDIKEMSDDDLRAYVAGLVSGLESKSTPRSDPGPDGMDGGPALPEERAFRPDPAAD